jgi:hypothetical protein
MGILDSHGDLLQKLPVIGSLTDGIISAGAGGTITQDMVNQAQQIKPAVDQANG